MENIYAVEMTQVKKRYGKNYAVSGIDLKVKKGEIFAILGPNGAGKTTLIRMLSTLIKIDEGEAKVFGVDVKKEPQKVRQLIGLTGQYATVDEKLTARENLIIFAQLNGLTKKQARLRARELLADFSLEYAKDRQLKEFSGGMRRRLDLAISLITRPPLIFLDEPTTGLDPRTRGEMWDTIRGLVDSGSTILLTTQYLEEADQLADNIVIIDQGRVVAKGTSDELKTKVGNSSFELSLLEPAQMSKAKSVVEATLKQQATILPEGHVVTVPMGDTKKMTELLVKLEENGIEIQQFAVRQPSLDEVFLALTEGR